MNLPRHRNRNGHCARLLALVALVLVAAPAAAQGAADADTKPCVECHEKQYEIADSRHFVRGDARTPAGRGEECTGCHGDVSAHARNPRKEKVAVVFGRKAQPGPQNDMCLTCHQAGARIHWQGSAHERSRQACASCHRSHAPRDPVLIAETQAGVCFDCHQERRAEMLKLSTHALKTGFFSCTSCHQPHGSTTRALLAKHSVNDTCYTCHADKRGPFLWEHPSAKDDCTNCHNPHGTNHAPMLKVRQPYLCQQCHQNVFHPSTAYTGANLPPYPGAAANNLPGDKMLGRSCTNCHVRVHGSNHPSGARLQR